MDESLKRFWGGVQRLVDHGLLTWEDLGMGQKQKENDVDRVSVLPDHRGEPTGSRMVSQEERHEDIPPEVAKANALLIAAAPEMLAVLERVYALFRHSLGKEADLTVAVENAIRKAKGE